MDMAQPHATWLEWVTDAQAASSSVVDGLDWQTGGIIVGLLAIVGFARRFAPLLGPTGAAVTAAIDGIASIALPKAHKEALSRAQVAHESLWQIVEVIESVSTDDPVVKQLKKAISEKTPAQFNALFDEWKKNRG